MTREEQREWIFENVARKCKEAAEILDRQPRLVSSRKRPRRSDKPKPSLRLVQ